jgi:predicted O-methyltransferase YrrM
MKVITKSADVITRLQRVVARIFLRVIWGVSTYVAPASRRMAMKLVARLETMQRPVHVKAVSDVPAPRIDLASADPLAVIMAAQEFTATTAFFAENPVTSRSLVSAQSQALLYCVIRNMRPDHVFEIGTFRGGTTEAICRALYANGSGKLHTVDPFSERVNLVFKQWPPALLDHVQLYEMDSMSFYTELGRERIRPGVVFVDGNHDYEFALFDIGAGARAILPGGFIFIDNVAQAGPFFAASDFLATHPGWRELGSSIRDYNREKAFDPERTTIVNTDFIVLRAPINCPVHERPTSFGVMRWRRSSVNGVRIKFLPPERPGRLIIQIVLRGFGLNHTETSAETVAQLALGTDEHSIPFTPPAQLAGQFSGFTVEPWLTWRGPEPLQLLQPPEPY